MPHPFRSFIAKLVGSDKAGGLQRASTRALLLFALIPALPGRTQSAPTLPDTLPNVRGGQFHLLSNPAQPLLLAFLQTVPDTADTPSRSQAVFLASMADQYGPRGLRVAIVDASTPGSAKPPSPDAVLNATYDWHLDVPLLFDPGARLARQLAVQQVPTTFLISADGRILQKWRGLTRPAVLAQSIQRLLAGSVK